MSYLMMVLVVVVRFDKHWVVCCDVIDFGGSGYKYKHESLEGIECIAVDNCNLSILSSLSLLGIMDQRYYTLAEGMSL